MSNHGIKFKKDDHVIVRSPSFWYHQKGRVRSRHGGIVSVLLQLTEPYTKTMKEKGWKPIQRTMIVTFSDEELWPDPEWKEYDEPKH